MMCDKDDICMDLNSNITIAKLQAKCKMNANIEITSANVGTIFLI